MSLGPTAAESCAGRLAPLPAEPWDVLTDFPRTDAADPCVVRSVLVPVNDSSSSAEKVDKADELDMFTAFAVALGALDHGREVVWLLDATGHKRPSPLHANLSHGTLQDLKERLSRERSSIAEVCGAEGRLPGQLADATGSPCDNSAAAAALAGAVAPNRFAAKRAHPVCQAAVFTGFPTTALEVGFPPDFAFYIAEAPKLAFRADLFEEATAHAVARHVAVLLGRRHAWNSTPILEAAALMLDEEERQRVLHTWNNTATAFDEGACVHELFERCARSGSREHVAIVSAELGASPWSYGQLDIAAGKVANALQSLPYDAGSRAALLMPRSANLVAAIYGILRAGYAYVPLDQEWPAERQLVIIEDIGASAIVMSEGLSAPPGSEHVAQLVISGGQDPVATPLCVSLGGGAFVSGQLVGAAGRILNPHMPVYILYTSGTTGKPKGVEVPHYGLVGRTEWLQHTWPLGHKETVAHKTPATFAISEWELFWPLCYGARIALAAPRMHGDAQHVAQLMLDQAVTHAVFVPSLLDQLLDELNGRALPRLRLIIACGEALKASIVKACCAGLPGAELVNLYGPTEGTMTMLRIPREPSAKDLLRFPIGVPIENTQIICACGGPPELQPSPVLAHGELIFGGPLIATGYWLLPELTKDKFVNNPYMAGKAYRSGDLGRWRSDGTLEFLGRLDNQVKFNGVRIELGEIESTLTALPGVRAAVAFLSPPHLVVVCTLGVAAPHDLEAERARLIEGLRNGLPKDRVPTRVEVLPGMPTTDRGKVDRKRLLDDFLLREDERAKAATAARSASLEAVTDISQTEVAIEALMRELLDTREPLPVTVRFQDLGFSSLLLGKLTTRIRRVCGLPGLPATAVYRAPTVRQLAALVDEEKRTEAAALKDSGGGIMIEAPPPTWRGLSATSRLSVVCTMAGLFVQSLINEFAFLPAYYVLWEIYTTFGLKVFCMLYSSVLLLDVLFVILFGVALKWLILGRRREGDFSIFGLYYWKWWIVHEIESFVAAHVSRSMCDTVLNNIYLSLLGAHIGAGARINKAHIYEADLIYVGAGARIEREATVNPTRLRAGELQLRRIHIGEGAHVAHRSLLAGGTSLAAKTRLSPMASADPFGPHHVVPYSGSPQTSTTLSLLQFFIGFPMIQLVEGAAGLPAILVMEWLWEWLSNGMAAGAAVGLSGEGAAPPGLVGPTPAPPLGRRGQDSAVACFLLAIPWIMNFVQGAAYFLCVVLVKWGLIGRFRPGPVHGDWDIFRRWLLERLTTTPTYESFMALWVNTEVLACCYRMLGASIASRVNMDHFGAVEFDLIEVEGDVVFGSSVLLVNTLDGVSQPLKLRRNACILDHSCVMPGTTVPEGALLGSFTVVPCGQQLEAMTVYTGCEGGTCVRLFQRPLLPGEHVIGERVVQVHPDDAGSPEQAKGVVMSPAALQQRELEAKALYRHSSCFWFGLFNAWCVLSAIIFAPLTELVYWGTIAIDLAVYNFLADWGPATQYSVAGLLLAPIYITITMALVFKVALLKWMLIGKWTAGDRPYYTWFHFRWAALMTAFGPLGELTEAIGGTALAVFFMRLMGAEVGERVCFFGHGFEYDLLHIGDEVCIGHGCDVTAHTVENMVMKMEQVRFEEGATCMSGALVMPGALMEARSTLIEHSQVLKGETVPRGCCFGGLPAKLLKGYPWPAVTQSGEQEGGWSSTRELATLDQIYNERAGRRADEEPLLTSGMVAINERSARLQYPHPSAPHGSAVELEASPANSIGSGMDFFQIQAGDDGPAQGQTRCLAS